MIASIFFYFALLVAIAWYSQRRSRLAHDKALDYFLGSRKLGVFPLAMTTAATYISASSFIGGPGVAYSRGLSWVFLAAVQYPVSLLMMGMLGRQLQQLGEQQQLYDLPDYIQLRYRSRHYSMFCAALIGVVLLLGLMVALMGGSRLLQGAISSLRYRQALLIFTAALSIYTMLGGFRAVVWTDVLQGTWMLLASFVLLFFLWQRAGGVEGLSRFAAEHSTLFQADSGGAQPLSYTVNFTILVGLGMVVQPISFSRLLAFDHNKSLRSSILISLPVLGLLTFLPHFIGFLGRIVVPELEQSDQLMGRLSWLFREQDVSEGIWGGIFSGMLVSALLAAVMSTADSILNTLGLTIYRHLLPRRLSGALGRISDRMLHSRQEQNKQGKYEKRHFQLSRLLSGVAILLMALLALNPPDLLVTLNLYALGTTQVALLWPVLLGMFSCRPDLRSAWCSSLAGLASYFLLNHIFPNFGGVALLPYSLLIGILGYFAAYLLSNRHRISVRNL